MPKEAGMEVMKLNEEILHLILQELRKMNDHLGVGEEE